MTYIIGEIGQNHNGSVDIAKLLVEIVARPVKDDLFDKTLRGMDAVKLTKRDLNYELAQSAMNAPYNSPHSFGKTYGEHREVLELTDEEHFEVYKHAKAHQLDFVETLCAPTCLSILKLFTPDKLKVASRDLTNLPLLDAMGETKIPIIISTGMANEREVDEAIETLARHHSDISILHCVSEYPTHYENLNLASIPYMMKRYPQYTIGYSDHTIGISTPLAAVAMGAKIIEKHITVDRKMKGTDQAGSLGIDGIQRMMRDIRNFEEGLGQEGIFTAPSTASSRKKLERSVATKHDLKAGHVIAESDLILLSPGDGFKWRDRQEVIGKVLKEDIPSHEVIYPKHF